MQHCMQDNMLHYTGYCYILVYPIIYTIYLNMTHPYWRFPSSYCENFSLNRNHRPYSLLIFRFFHFSISLYVCVHINVCIYVYIENDMKSSLLRITWTQLIDRHVKCLRRQRMTLRCRATFHQSSRRNIAVQADTK